MKTLTLTAAGIPDTPLLERAPGSRESGGWSAFWPTGCSAGREQCGAVWSKAAGSSDTLTYDKAGPYVTNMQAADPDNDGKFTKSEFMEACKKGLVQAGSKPGETGGGQTPEKPTKP